MKHKLKPYIILENGCWLWRYSKDSKGYGTMWDKETGKVRKSHRVFYENHIGIIPDGKQLHHKCENKSCVNPSHLEVVTPLEQSARHNKSSIRWINCVSVRKVIIK